VGYQRSQRRDQHSDKKAAATPGTTVVAGGATAEHGAALLQQGGRFIVANTTVARAMGLQSPDDLIGKTDFDFFPREFAADSSNSTPAITLVTSTRSRTHPRQRLIPAQPLESSAATPAS